MNISTKPQWHIAALEIIVMVLAVIFIKKAFDPYFWRFAGPVTLGIIMVALTFYLRIRGQSWESLGLRRLPNRKDKLKLIPQVLLTVVAMALAITLVSVGAETLGWEFMKEVPQGVEDRWGDVKGNIPLFLVWVAISWVIAGFSEEVIFRGFMISRLTTLFGSVKYAAIFAVIVAGVFFGYLHFYNQGYRGFITAGMIGITFGIMYLLFKRNLWPLVIVHACIDTLGFTLTYLGIDA